MKIRGKRMLEVMALKKVTCKDLSALLGCHVSLIYHALKGRRCFSIKYSKKLIEFFGAELMSRVIDWGAMGIKDPLAVII